MESVWFQIEKAAWEGLGVFAGKNIVGTNLPPSEIKWLLLQRLSADKTLFEFEKTGMINRELIRLKVVQLVYANYKNEKDTIEDAMDELSQSLNKSYELYQYLLLLIPEVTGFARQLYESTCARIKDMGGTDFPSSRFVDNRLSRQIAENKQLDDFYVDSVVHPWTNTETELRALYKIIHESEEYKEYVTSEEDSYENDKRFWKKVYKKYVCNNESLENYLEEWSLYWNDDKHIVDSFVLKTLNRFEEANGADQPLLPAFDSEEDSRFARELFRNALLNKARYEDLIAQNSHNWEFERLSQMDIVIMVTALAEITTFPEIKLNVSFSEYLSIAKTYSSPKSVSFINGLLDNIVQKMKKEKSLTK